MKTKQFLIGILLITQWGNISIASAQSNNERINKWEEDIVKIEKIIIIKHYNAFTYITQSEFEQEIKNIKSDIGSINDYQIKSRLSNLIAKIKDSHTTISFPPESLFPFSFAWFDDGIYMINGGKDQSEFLGQELIAIGGLSLDSAIKNISSIIPHENIYQLKTQIPAYLIRPDILYGLGIINDLISCDYVFKDSNNEAKKIIASAIQKSDFGSFSRNMKWIKRKKHPLTGVKSKSPYWYKIVDSSKFIYLNYTSCYNQTDYPFSLFTKDLMKVCDSLSSYKLIVDIRQNGGGNSGVILPLIEEIIKRDHLNTPEKLVVLIGRKTFSSAVLNAIDFKNKTKATFIGEPTRGKPNHFGEIMKEKLNNSNIIVSYSTKYFKNMDGDPDSFYPDQIIPYNFIDYLLGNDPAINYSILLK